MCIVRQLSTFEHRLVIHLGICRWNYAVGLWECTAIAVFFWSLPCSFSFWVARQVRSKVVSVQTGRRCLVVSFESYVAELSRFDCETSDNYVLDFNAEKVGVAEMLAKILATGLPQGSSSWIIKVRFQQGVQMGVHVLQWGVQWDHLPIFRCPTSSPPPNMRSMLLDNRGADSCSCTWGAVFRSDFTWVVMPKAWNLLAQTVGEIWDWDER